MENVCLEIAKKLEGYSVNNECGVIVYFSTSVTGEVEEYAVLVKSVGKQPLTLRKIVFRLEDDFDFISIRVDEEEGTFDLRLKQKVYIKTDEENSEEN